MLSHLRSKYISVNPERLINRVANRLINTIKRATAIILSDTGTEVIKLSSGSILVRQ